MAEESPLQPVLRYLKVAVGPEGSGVSDGELLQRFATSRDEAAFELLLWRHGAMVQRVCRHVLQDHHAAEDACQAAFLTLARKASAIARKEAVAGWLYRVAKRIAVKLAQRTRTPHALVEVPAPPLPPTDADLLRAVQDEVARLPDRYRVPVLLCFFEGLTHADAAQRLNWPIGTVAGRLARAKTLLHQRLTRRGLALPTTGLAGVLFVDAASALTPTFVRKTTSATLTFLHHGPTMTELPTHILTLSNGVMQTMKHTKWAYAACSALLLTGVLGSTLAWGQRGAAPDPVNKEAPKQPASKLSPPPPAAAPQLTYEQRRRSRNNLKQLAIGIWNYHDANGHLPQDITDKDGKPLLSWRVVLLPYIEADNVIKQFKLDEPWDSEHNKKLLNVRISAYTTGTEAEGTGDTFYQFFSGDKTVMEPGKKVKVSDITDGTSNTLGIVEAGPAVPWTKPADILYHPKKAIPKLVGPYPGIINVAMMDGSTRVFKPDINEDVLRLLIECADGNAIDAKKLEDAAANLKLNSDEEKKLYTDAQTALVKLTEEMVKHLEEHKKLDSELQRLTKKSTVNLDDLLDEVEHRKQELAALKAQNEKLRKELEALKK